MKVILNVYDDNDNIIKQCEGQTAGLRFGFIRRLMKLTKIDDVNDTAALFATIAGAWDSLCKLLSKVFPDMTDEDWDGVEVSELMPVIVAILKNAIKSMKAIPEDSKN